MGKYRSSVLQRWLFDATIQRCVRVNHHTFLHLQKWSRNYWKVVEIKTRQRTGVEKSRNERKEAREKEEKREEMHGK